MVVTSSRSGARRSRNPPLPRSPRLRKSPCEAVACGDDGIASFDRIRYRRHDASVFLYAFDLIELDGEDLRRDPLAVRKATLASPLAGPAGGLRFNEHMEHEDGPLEFAHACKLGLEGIASKRRSRRTARDDR